MNPMKLVLAGLLLAATGTDLAGRKIPNALIGAGLCLFLASALWRLFGGDIAYCAGCLLAGALAFALHLVPYLLRGMGAGDVKLALVMGLLMGWQDWLGHLGCYCLVLLFAAALTLIPRKKKPKTLPLAPMMAAAYFLYLLPMI